MRFHNISKIHGFLFLGCLTTGVLSVSVMAAGPQVPTLTSLPYKEVKLERTSRLSLPQPLSSEQFEARFSVKLAPSPAYEEKTAALEDALVNKSYVVYSAIMPSLLTLEEEGQDEDDSSTLPEYAPSALASK